MVFGVQGKTKNTGTFRLFQKEAKHPGKYREFFHISSWRNGSLGASKKKHLWRWGSACLRTCDFLIQVACWWSCLSVQCIKGQGEGCCYGSHSNLNQKNIMFCHLTHKKQTYCSHFVTKLGSHFYYPWKSSLSFTKKPRNPKTWCQTWCPLLSQPSPNRRRQSYWHLELQRAPWPPGLQHKISRNVT